MNNFIITKDGYKLYSGALIGNSLEFTKLCIGSGKRDGTEVSEQEAKALTELYTLHLELTDLTVTNGALTCVDVTDSVTNLEELPESAAAYENGSYVYIIASNELYRRNGAAWEKKTVNSEIAEAGGYFYDIASGKLQIYTFDESIVTIKVTGNNAPLKSGFYEKELGLYAKNGNGESEILFAYAYVRNTDTNFISPMADGVINLEYSIAFSVLQNASIEIINAGTASVSASVFNELSKTVNTHIENADKIHEGLKKSLGVMNLSDFSVGSIVIEKNSGEIPEHTSDENIKAGDTFSVIIAKLKRVISNFYKHKHKVNDIEDINKVIDNSIVVGSYVGDGTAARKIQLGFTPRLVEVYCPGYDDYSNRGGDFSGIAVKGINAVTVSGLEYIKSYHKDFCTVSICDGGFLVSEATTNYNGRAHTNVLNRQYIYKAVK